MENRHKKELIGEIASLLQAHEEPYELGSWENFVKEKQSKKRFPMAWIGYAAAILVLLSLLPFAFNRNAAPEVAQRVVVAPKRVTPPVERPTVTEKHIPAKQTDIKLPQQLPPVKLAIAMAVPAFIVADTMIVGEDITAATAAVKQEGRKEKPRASEIAPSRNKDINTFLENESRMASAMPVAKSSKWDFGIELLPTLSDAKLNMGAGITTAYKLSDRFSLSTGISYVALDAEKMVDHQPVSLMSTKKLVGTEASIKAIDIPLALTYHVNKKVFTSVGLSYFNVLNETRTNSYSTEMAVTRTMQNPETGMLQIHKTNLVEETVERTEEQPLSGNSYIGFFNFSIGHQQQLYKNHHLVLEPFIKVPLGKLSTNDLKLSNGGIKLRYSF